MKRMESNLIALLTAAAWCAVAGGPRAAAEPPRVVKAVPDDGAINVNPGPSQVRVTFDQEMLTDRYAWTGGGPTFPKTTGSPRWIDARTCVLPVDLQPNYRYWVGVNSEWHKTFQNTKGEAAVPYAIAFATGPAPNDKPLTPARNKAAVAALRKAIDERYSYRDLRGLAWPALFEKHTPGMLEARAPVGFAVRAGALLAQTKDIHIWLESSGQTIPAFERRVTPNYNGRTVGRLVPDCRQASACVWTGRFEDGIGCLMITTWAGDQEEAVLAAVEALKGFQDAKGLIVDVRPNAGGSEPLARRFAGCFVEKPAVYAKHVTRKVSAPGGFTKPQERVLEPNKDGPTYRGRVAVLMGPVNMSSGEAFLLMMKQVPNCRLIGARSYGASGNPQPVDLGNGVTVYLPSWQAMLPDGACFEGKGVAPDAEVKTTAKVLETGDPILAAALDYLRKP